MPKQVILLAGLHKTGTTSIQQTCAANQKALFSAGFAYPTLLNPGAAGPSNHTQILNHFKREPGKAGLMGQFSLPRPRKPGSFLSKFARDLDTISARLLMVAEGVSLFDEDELRQLKAWFGAGGWEMRVICHVRHLPSWINSMVAQRATSAIRLTIDQAVDDFVQYQSIVRKRIEALRQVFPQAEFYSHEQAVRHASGPVGFFLEKAGVELQAPIHVIRANEGSSDCATRVLSLINERFGRFDSAGAPNPQFFGDRRFIDTVRGIGGRKFALRPHEVAPILPLIKADNEWLKTHLGQRFHDSALEFQDLNPDWSPESLAQLESVLKTVPAAVRDWVLANRERLGVPR